MSLPTRPGSRTRASAPVLPAPAPLLAESVVRHYRAHARDLPWRGLRDPYATWVSEVMLQQTQVETVKRYFEPFLRRFPDVTALADAPLEEVLSAWSGLGYYRRARLLHRGAQVVRDRHGGRIPSDPAALRALPGVGDYTAGALLSIAFDTPAAAVDGNVVRVLARVTGTASPLTPPALHDTVLSLHGRHAPSDVTQSLMELGATVCTPARPRCESCPWQGPCVAHARGMQDRIPPPRVRAERRALHVPAALVVDDDAILLRVRAGEGLFGGLWELPSATEVHPAGDGDAPSEDRLRRALERDLPWLRAGALLVRTRRTLTHRDLSVWVFAATAARATAVPDGRWVPAGELAKAPLSTAMRRAIVEAREALAARAAERHP